MTKMQNIENAIAGDAEAAARYSRLAEAASSTRMQAHYRKCAVESAIACISKKHQQAAK